MFSQVMSTTTSPFERSIALGVVVHPKASFRLCRPLDLPRMELPPAAFGVVHLKAGPCPSVRGSRAR